MVTITKYPQTAAFVKTEKNQYDDWTEADWANINNIKASDDIDASSYVASHSGTVNKPGKVIASNFGFSLPDNAKINSIEVGWEEYVKNPSGGNTGVPTIPSKDIVLYKANGGANTGVKVETTPVTTTRTLRSMNFTLADMPNVKPVNIEDSGFGVLYTPATNTAGNPGRLFLDYIRVTVDYTNPILPTYSLGATLTASAKVGEQVTYVLTLTNNILPSGAIPVSITLPSGLTYASQSGNGSYSTVTGKWSAVLDINKVAKLTLVLDSTSDGIKAITATVDGSSVSITQSTSIIVAPLTDTLELTLEALTPGEYTQTITATNAITINNQIIIIPADIGDCNYVEIPLPAELKVYMQHGVEYFVSCEMELISELSGAVYNGYNNFSIALVIGDDEEEKDDSFEEIGTSPDTFNTYERVYTQFVYDQNADMTIKIYGQYSGLEPGLYNVRFGKWSISNLSADFEESGGLINDPSYLCDNGNYATLNLDGGESSKSIVLGNFHLGGLEFDPTIIIKGIGIQLDYICNNQSTLNVTITNNGQVSTQSIILNPAQTTMEIGGQDDKWDLINIDLTNIQVSYTITNTRLDPISLQLKNVQFNLYSTPDATNGNMGFTLDDEHSRNYGIFMSNDGAKNEGTVPTITTYDVANSEGELITQIDLKAKKITAKFRISGESQIDAQNNLIEATKYLSNDLNPNNGLPLPNVMVFDWDPDREYNVVLSDEIKVSLDTFIYTCEAIFTVAEGIGWNELKNSGAIGTNEGIINVRPLITLLTMGGNVQIFDNVSYQSLTINNDFDPNITIVIDCDNRIIIDENGNDYSTKITLNSFWQQLKPGSDFDFSSSTGCLVQSVQFREGS